MSAETVSLIAAAEVTIRIESGLNENILAQCGPLLHEAVEVRMVCHESVGDLRLLDAFPKLKRLNIIDDSGSDLSYLQQLGRLEGLWIENSFDFDIDFACWPELREFGDVYGKRRLRNIGRAEHLETLRLWSWSEQDLQTLAHVPALKELQIVEGRLKKLDGVENIRGLRSLSLAYLRNLDDFSALSKAQDLEILSIRNCKKLRNLEPFAELRSLRWLDLDNTGEIDSLRPLKKLSSLRQLNFREETNILDGDTDIVNRMGVAYGFKNRRHYNFNYDHLRGDRN